MVSDVTKWCQMFKEGRTNIHDGERSSRLSLISENLKNTVDKHIRTNRHFTLDENHKFPQIYHLLIHEMIAEHLHYKNFVQDGFHRCSPKSMRASVWVLI
jgi:hypothetical protein